MSTQQSAREFFQAEFKKICRALLKDSKTLGSAKMWCPWATNNKVFVNQSHSGFITVLPGLCSLGIITRMRVVDVETLLDLPTAWLLSKYGRKSVFRIEKPELLTTWQEEPPCKTVSDWVAYWRTRRLPPTLEAMSFTALVNQVCATARQEPTREAKLLAQALVKISTALNTCLPKN